MRASLTNESIDRACDEIERFLTKRGVERKERLRIKLGAEEALMTNQKAFGAERDRCRRQRKGLTVHKKRAAASAALFLTF